VAHQIQPIARALALGAGVGVGQPDGRHEVAPGQDGEDPGVDLVGLGREWREALGLGRIGDEHIPAVALQLVMDEAGPVHRLDGRGHRATEPSDPLRQRAQGIGIGMDSERGDRLATLIEDMDLESPARQVQAGV